MEHKFADKVPPCVAHAFEPVHDYSTVEDMPKETTRTSVLMEANKIVNGARNKAYGDAEDNFRNIAGLWEAYFTNKGSDVVVTPIDVANMMVLMKIARLQWTPSHRDSWVDIAGYAACGAEIGLK